MEDKTKIGEFVDHLLAKNIGKLGVVKYINHLIVLARVAGKPLGSADRKDIEKIVGQINTTKYEENTKHDYKVAIRKYFQWLRGCDEESGEFPEEVRWIKPGNKKKRLLPEALVNKEDLKKLIDAADNLRDKALIAVDYDTGGRVGEILSSLIKHVTFDKYGAVIMLDGKTGPRRRSTFLIKPLLKRNSSQQQFLISLKKYQFTLVMVLNCLWNVWKKQASHATTETMYSTISELATKLRLET